MLPYPTAICAYSLADKMACLIRLLKLQDSLVHEWLIFSLQVAALHKAAYGSHVINALVPEAAWQRREMYGPAGFLGLPVAVSPLSPEMMRLMFLPCCLAELPPPSYSPGSSVWAQLGDLS